MTDVYVAGHESNEAHTVAKVWKSGVATPLTDGTQYAGAQSVAISGSDVYVVGDEASATRWVAKVWKNSVAAPLTNGTRDAHAHSVAVSGSDVYVAGYESNGTPLNEFTGTRVAVLWKNGVATRLTDGTREAAANSVFLNVH